MEEPNLLEKILQNTYTLDVLKKRTQALKQQVDIELFGLKVGPKNQRQEQEAWIASLGKDFFKSFTKDDFQQVFDALDKKIIEIAMLVIYFPFEPGPSQIVLIGAWLRQNFDKNLIFDIKYDYSLIGGCAFVWKGVYRDYSVRARLAANKEKILDSFRSFLKQK